MAYNGGCVKQVNFYLIMALLAAALIQPQISAVQLFWAPKKPILVGQAAMLCTRYKPELLPNQGLLAAAQPTKTLSDCLRIRPKLFNSRALVVYNPNLPYQQLTQKISDVADSKITENNGPKWESGIIVPATITKQRSFLVNNRPPLINSLDNTANSQELVGDIIAVPKPVSMWSKLRSMFFSSSPQNIADLNDDWIVMENDHQKWDLDNGITHALSDNNNTAIDCWKKLDKEQFEKSFLTPEASTSNSPVRPRCVYRYRPESCNADKKILIVVAHGTWSSKSEQFHHQNDSEFNNILLYAQQEAEQKKTTVDVLSWQWTGDDLDTARTASGQSLALLLNNIKQNYSHVATVAHSHGANIINIASHYTNFDIDRMIHFAVPVVISDDNYLPNKVKEVFNFYSTGDAVQYLGSINRNLSYVKSLIAYGSCRKYPLEYIQAHRRIYNIRTQVNGANPGHSDLRAPLLSRLPAIIAGIKNNYNYQDDLDINIENTCSAQEALTMTLRTRRTMPEIAAIYSIALGDYADVKNQIEKQISFNSKQEEQFREQHKQENIHNKGYVAVRMFDFLSNLRKKVTSQQV